MAILQSEATDSLPPLMNPAMLEASDDLTNLSHLNEPAGQSTFLIRTRFFVLIYE